MSRIRQAYQALVIGSGVAGACCALRLADQGYHVALLSAGDFLGDGNTAYAQGGIVGRGQDDTPSLLSKDIMQAGCQHNHVKAVNHLAKCGPDAVREMLVERLRVPFARNGDGSLAMTREGAHSVHRVLFCGDYTGKAIMDCLAEAVRNEPNIRVMTRRTAVDLITSLHHTGNLSFRYCRTNQCLGAYVYNQDSNEVETLLADFTVLATGGAGRLFLHSTNAQCSLGAAMAMAHRAGARIMNAEYVQFHPTALFHRSKRLFLITEAMRGEGAHLLDRRGDRFMGRYDARLELAPRDVVSRAIVDTLHRTGDDCVYLDCRPVEHELSERFPTIHARCRDIGIDIDREPIPVVPAAHYHCGGVFADISGRTSLDRLYAVGECSCTGVHGANRLASTSLLEGVLWGRNAGDAIGARLGRGRSANQRMLRSIPDWQHPGQVQNEDPALIAQDWMSIRSTMWNYAGINRTEQRLARACEDLRVLIKDLTSFYRKTPLSKPLIDLYHGCFAAGIIAMSARSNRQSLGCHHLQ
ncbi:L-aspartate oxidase [Pseudodesulfovibrio portus]|uniref:L-aspartate oxidase n=1 Tax=Pseudodesulfovibrio portus TaxID=231439 RepID=A0ABM8AWG9_9BACT|nr:L-aspartate oxidase [Pseudodesulfovibrio portus]BDQ35596.1 L-aspartate oxidase [Pseudodesulfovibrio portus]